MSAPPVHDHMGKRPPGNSGAARRMGMTVDSAVLPPHEPGAPDARSPRAWYPWGPRHARSKAAPSPVKARGEAGRRE
jgi:hypothetical protein